MKRLLRFMDWPLRAKMAALLVIASILPLGAATLINIREARERLMANTADLLAARADHLTGQLDIFHRGYQRSVDRIAHLPNVVEFSQSRPVRADQLKPSVHTLLEVWPASDSNIRGIAILDLSGTVQIASEDALIGMNLSYHSYVQEALRAGAITSNIHLAESQVGSSPTIAYVAPVLGSDRKMIGLAVLWIRATALWDVMKASNGLAGPGSFAVLFDHQGIRIAHTYSEEIVFHPGGRLDPATINALVAERRFGEKTRALLEDVRAFPEQFDRARAKSPDKAVFRGFAPVNRKWNYGVARRFDTVPWTIFYMIPEESLNAQITVMTRQKTLFAGIIILVALLAGSLLAAFILKPIGSLSTATKLIAGGDLAARVRPGYADEVGRLGTSFNSMAEQIEAQAKALQGANDDLEFRVQERTAALLQTTRDLEVEIAERKRAELVAARFAAIVEYSSDAIVGKDLQSKVTSWNASAERVFGYTAAEMLGQPITLLIPTDRQDDEERILKRINRGERVEPFETVRVRKDGGLIDVSVTVSPIKNATGQIVGASKVARDISERKRVEQSLRDTQARLNSALAAGAIGTWSWDIVNDRLFADEFTARSFSIEESAAAKGLPATAYLQVIHKEDQPRVEDALARAIQSCGHYDIEYRVRQKDGEFRWLQARGRVEGDAAGNALHFHGAVLDITERKQAEQALQVSEERLRLSQQVARVGTFDWNIQTGVNQWTPELEAMYGLRPGDFAGSQQTWEQLIFSEDRAEAVRQVSLAMEGKNFEAEWRVVWPDGTVHWLAGRARVFVDENGKPLRLLGVNIDITERKEAEKRIEHLNRVYAVLSDINQMIVRTRNPQAIFAEACRIAVDKGKFRLAWIGLLDQENQRIEPQAWAGAEDGYLTLVNIDLRNEAIAQGQTPTAVREGRHVICNDLDNDPRMAPWRDEALKRGYRSSAAFPLKLDDVVAGNFNLYASEVGFFDDEEVRLLAYWRRCGVADRTRVQPRQRKSRSRTDRTNHHEPRRKRTRRDATRGQVDHRDQECLPR